VQQIVIPILAGTATTRQTAGGSRTTTNARGLAVLHSSPLNKGTVFTVEERKALGLTGLLRPHISTLRGQVKHAWGQYEGLTDSLSAPLRPHVEDLGSFSSAVAIAVVQAALIEGTEVAKLDDIAQDVLAAMWQPDYSRLQAL
jgi:hypothetical protein